MSVGLILSKVKDSLEKTNDVVASFIAATLSSVWCFHAFLVLSVAPLVFSQIMTTAQYLSSGIFQLVALPVLAYVSDKGAKAMMNLMRDMHALLTKQVKELHDISVNLSHDVRNLHEKHDALRATLIENNPDFEDINAVDTESGTLL